MTIPTVFTDLKIPVGRRPLTPGEARASAWIGLAVTLMFLAAILQNYSPRSLSVFMIILLWIPMLAVHEAGHAIAAKLLGWRVREIVIGFGRDLARFHLGETNVKIKLAPVEGYVLPTPRSPTHLRLKSMLIYAAGPGAEFLVLGAMLMGFGWDTVFNHSDELPLIALKSLAIVILLGAGFNLLPFQTEGAVSDGLGIISAPFITEESIELRLLTAELREVQTAIQLGQTKEALKDATLLLEKFPGNFHLQQLLASALAADKQEDAARDYVREKLAKDSLPDNQRLGWLKLQGMIELDSADPDFMTLDLALQRALRITPGAPGLIAIKGASLVLRERYEEGGNLLAHVWRRNDGSAEDATLLAYLTIAASGCGDAGARQHFESAFEKVNPSAALRQRVHRLTGS